MAVAILAVDFWGPMLEVAIGGSMSAMSEIDFGIS